MRSNPIPVCPVEQVRGFFKRHCLITTSAEVAARSLESTESRKEHNGKKQQRGQQVESISLRSRIEYF